MVRTPDNNDQSLNEARIQTSFTTPSVTIRIQELGNENLRNVNGSSSFSTDVFACTTNSSHKKKESSQFDQSFFKPATTNEEEENIPEDNVSHKFNSHLTISSPIDTLDEYQVKESFRVGEDENVSLNSSFEIGHDEEPTNEYGVENVEQANELTDEQRLRREQEESENLARQLMAEEAMESYRLSTHFLEDHTEAYSAEDLAALRIAMAEGDTNAIDDEFETDAELSYEAMLSLGERMGDVKQERWEMIAMNEIRKLPKLIYQHSLLKNANAGDDSLCQCLICQCGYESGETLRKLPCNHYFHADCVDQWLQSKDVCPYCRQSILVKK